MKIAITGASGLIGQELTARLESGGHEVIRMVRRRGKEKTGNAGRRYNRPVRLATRRPRTCACNES